MDGLTRDDITVGRIYLRLPHLVGAVVAVSVQLVTARLGSDWDDGERRDCGNRLTGRPSQDRHSSS